MPDEPGHPRAEYKPAWVPFHAVVSHVMQATACDQVAAGRRIRAACEDGAIASRYGNTHDDIAPVSWKRAAIGPGYVPGSGNVLVTIVPRPGELIPQEMFGPPSPDGVAQTNGWRCPLVEVRREDVERRWPLPKAKIASRTGRPPKYLYDMIRADAFRAFEEKGLPGPDAGDDWQTQSKLEERLAGFCKRVFESEPATSTVQSFAQRATKDWKAEGR